jgi:Flp pilus assembly protein TadG
MKPAFIQRRPQHLAARCRERGVTMVLVAISMVAIIAMAAWSIDLVTLYLARQEAQRAADAGALAAARVISVSGITGTANPTTDPSSWASICGGPNSAASQAAQAVAMQNAIGTNMGTVTVTYFTGTKSGADCTSLDRVFAVNPMVTVQVQRTGLPTFFSRAWSYRSESVSATATAEAFNPSDSNSLSNGGPTGDITPVQPRCVKPWMVPNLDPGNCSPAGSSTCSPFVSNANGSIQNAGIVTAGSGVIGENFRLFANCAGATIPCTPITGTPPPPPFPTANVTVTGAPLTPNLEYWPGHISGSSVAVPSCATAGSGGVAEYEPAVAGCDQTTVYECGVPIPPAGTGTNAVDLNENPAGATGDTAHALACSLTGQTSVPLSGQDTLDTTSYPFTISAGASNPFKIPHNTLITSSNQIVSLPIYDPPPTFPFVGNRAPVTIVGFLQVFINGVDSAGNISVTVLNVAGCGNGATTPTTTAITGTSPVPVRLITPQ